MKPILCSFFIALILASRAHATEVGDRELQLRTELGNPVAIRKKPDESQVWKFKDGTTVWLANGVVQKFAGPVTGNAVRRVGSSEWAPFTLPSVPIATQSKKETRTENDERALRYFFWLGGLALIWSILRSGGIILRGGGWLLSRVGAPLVSLVWAASRARPKRVRF